MSVRTCEIVFKRVRIDKLAYESCLQQEKQSNLALSGSSFITIFITTTFDVRGVKMYEANGLWNAQSSLSSS